MERSKQSASERPVVAVCGAADCGADLEALAESVGRELAEAGAWLLTGGRGGVMAAASRGARLAGGEVVGILPGQDAASSGANAHLSLPIHTGLGQGRNLVLVLSAQAVIAIGGGWGTLSEIGLALKHGRPVVCLESWRLQRPDGQGEPLLLSARGASEAVAEALRAAEEVRAG